MGRRDFLFTLIFNGSNIKCSRNSKLWHSLHGRDLWCSTLWFTQWQMYVLEKNKHTQYYNCNVYKPLSRNNARRRHLESRGLDIEVLSSSSAWLCLERARFHSSLETTISLLSANSMARPVCSKAYVVSKAVFGLNAATSSHLSLISHNMLKLTVVTRGGCVLRLLDILRLTCNNNNINMYSSLQPLGWIIKIGITVHTVLVF